MAGGTLGGSATTSAAARLALAAAASPSRPAAALTRPLILTITATAAGSRAPAHQFGQRQRYRQGYHALEEQKRHQPPGAYLPQPQHPRVPRGRPPYPPIVRRLALA